MIAKILLIYIVGSYTLSYFLTLFNIKVDKACCFPTKRGYQIMWLLAPVAWWLTAIFSAITISEIWSEYWPRLRERFLKTFIYYGTKFVDLIFFSWESEKKNEG